MAGHPPRFSGSRDAPANRFCRNLKDFIARCATDPAQVHNEIDTVKLQFLGMVILLAMACASACVDEGAEPVPEPRSPAQPGQAIVAIGSVTGGGQMYSDLSTGTIDTITVRAGLAPGAKPVSLENISIVYADAVRTESLQPVEGFRGTPGQGLWGISGVTDEIFPANLRLDDREAFLIQINPKAPVVPRQVITIAIKPLTGTPLILRLMAPPTIAEGDNIFSPL